MGRCYGGEASASEPAQGDAREVLAVRHGPPNRPIRRQGRKRRAGHDGVAGASGLGCRQKSIRDRVNQVGGRRAGIHGLTEGNGKRRGERDIVGAIGGNGGNDGGLGESSPQGHQRKQQDEHPDQIIAANRKRKEIHIIPDSSYFPAADARGFLGAYRGNGLLTESALPGCIGPIPTRAV